MAPRSAAQKRSVSSPKLVTQRQLDEITVVLPFIRETHERPGLFGWPESFRGDVCRTARRRRLDLRTRQDYNGGARDRSHGRGRETERKEERAPTCRPTRRTPAAPATPAATGRPSTTPSSSSRSTTRACASR